MYENAIKELHAIDPASAAWLRITQPEPNNNECVKHPKTTDATYELDSFLWTHTPQGLHHWCKMYEALGGEQRIDR